MYCTETEQITRNFVDLRHFSSGRGNTGKITRESRDLRHSSNSGRGKAVSGSHGSSLYAGTVSREKIPVEQSSETLQQWPEQSVK